MKPEIRRSSLSDLDLLQRIELDAFPKWQQSSRRTLRLSLQSSAQTVFIAELGRGKNKKPVGCLILHLHKKTLRIYSVAVRSEFQGKGYGEELMRFAENYALSKGFSRLSLEVVFDNKPLVNWYKKFGFETAELLKNYYLDGLDAFRMVKILEPDVYSAGLTNLLVVDDPSQWDLELEDLEITSARSYTSDKGFYSKKNLRVFNLCNSYKYQKLGYYVSLLASAREHRAIPSVATIRDLGDLKMISAIAEDIEELIQQSLTGETDGQFQMFVYFGRCRNAEQKKLAREIFRLFEVPLFSVTFEQIKKWRIKKIEPLSMDSIQEEDREFIGAAARQYFSQRRFRKQRLKNYQYDLAILINKEEDHPPSDAKALDEFRKAADELDLYVEFISKSDINRLSEFDALFIRETTDVSNHTYQFARKAYAEGLVVIDDPWSILKCSNKIFLEERLRTNGIPTPKTHILFRGELKKGFLKNLSYPLILKKPDSAFSLGVVKVNTEEELKSTLKDLFKQSELVIAQEYTPSEFDWRIGVLDNQALFACKYFMAKDHWQIYDWKSGEEDPSGDFETLPVEEVPGKVIKTAVKTASLIGDGLYGVDLKEIDGRVYVIEVNDNPNIDHGIEDLKSGKILYQKIVQSIKKRIEISRNVTRFVSVDEI